jgi:hypothetical protein
MQLLPHASPLVQTLQQALCGCSLGLNAGGRLGRGASSTAVNEVIGGEPETEVSRACARNVVGWRDLASDFPMTSPMDHVLFTVLEPRARRPPSRGRSARAQTWKR